MNYRSLLVAAASAALWSCPKPVLPPEPPYVVFPPYEDAGSPDALCRLACENLAKIGCPESAPAPKPCADVCTDAERAGNPLNTICVANASTPDQVRACGSVECAGR